jgi:hypothetical protein
VLFIAIKLYVLGECTTNSARLWICDRQYSDDTKLFKKQKPFLPGSWENVPTEVRARQGKVG